MNQADFVLPPLNHASERAAVELQHALEVEDAQHQMIDLPNADHVARIPDD